MKRNFEYVNNFHEANRIAAFDLSLRSTGCVTYYRGHRQMEENFLMESTNEEIMRESVKRMATQYAEVLEDFQPDVVAHESITAGGPGTQFLSIKYLSMAYALMLEAILQLDYEPLIMSFGPTQIKKAACGDHQAAKNQVLLGVYKKWEEEFEEDDVADAFVCAKLAERVFDVRSNFLEQYENHVENGDMDTDKFLLEYDKGRIKHGVDDEDEFEVVKSTMMSKDFLKNDNDYELYQEAREIIRAAF